MAGAQMAQYWRNTGASITRHSMQIGKNAQSGAQMAQPCRNTCAQHAQKKRSGGAAGALVWRNGGAQVAQRKAQKKFTFSYKIRDFSTETELLLPTIECGKGCFQYNGKNLLE